MNGNPQIGENVYWLANSGSHMYDGTIDGETSRSWIVWGTKKLPKSTTVFASKDEFELWRWAKSERYSIGSAVERQRPEMLKRVAELIGYTGK